jgi:hypothetical protein
MKRTFLLAALMASVVAGQAVTINAGVNFNSGPNRWEFSGEVSDVGDAVVMAWAFDDAETQSRAAIAGWYLFGASVDSRSPGAFTKGDHIFTISFYDVNESIVDSFQVPYSIAFNAPDGGATAAMLGLGIAGLAFARRKMA